jgi:hypothetical protein
LDFAPVISSEHNDAVDPSGEWSTRSKIDASHRTVQAAAVRCDGPNTFDGEKADPLAFLLVKSMLLTGFDAPVEQVMYLDRHIKEAELLQAIARVNRTYAKGEVRRDSASSWTTSASPSTSRKRWPRTPPMTSTGRSEPQG